MLTISQLNEFRIIYLIIAFNSIQLIDSISIANSTELWTKFSSKTNTIMNASQLLITRSLAYVSIARFITQTIALFVFAFPQTLFLTWNTGLTTRSFAKSMSASIITSLTTRRTIFPTNQFAFAFHSPHSNCCPHFSLQMTDEKRGFDNR
jgi:hypothetical protein